MLKVLIADDNAMVREGIRQIIVDTIDMMVGGEATSGRQVLEMIRNEDWDLVLLDITMPGGSGLDTLKQLKKEKPDLPVLILSMHHEEEYAIRSINAGVSGYLSKENVPEELTTAIRKVAKGSKYISQSLVHLFRDTHPLNKRDKYFSHFLKEAVTSNRFSR